MTPLEYPVSEDVLERAKAARKGTSVDLLMELSRGAQLPEQIKPYMFGQLTGILISNEARAMQRPLWYLIGFLAFVSVIGWGLLYNTIMLIALGVL
jgi:hypothetical protein